MGRPSQRPTKKPGHKSQDDPAQSKRFIGAARKAGADETREGADRAFKTVMSKKPKRDSR